MNKEVTDFLLENNYRHTSMYNGDCYVRSYEMCRCCGRLWCVVVFSDGHFAISDDFGHVCWTSDATGDYADANSPRVQMLYNGETHIRVNQLNTVEDAKMLCEFINSYRMMKDEIANP